MIIEKINKIILEAIKKQKIELGESTFLIEKCKNIKFGDFSSNVALVLAKKNGLKPMDIANKLCECIKSDENFSKVDVANPGFINLWLSNKYKNDLINDILDKKNNFGKLAKKSQKYSVEYVSANPTGLLHIGHARNAVLGNCLINVLEWYGIDVVSEYVVNDAGNQMNNLATAVFIRYKQLFGEKIELPKDSYHGNEIILVAQELKSKFNDKFLKAKINEKGRIDNDDFEHEIRWFARDKFLEIIKNDLHDLGVDIQCYFSEYQIHQKGLIKKMIDDFLTRKEAYKKDNAIWLNTTKYGDDKDRVLIKSDGTPTYFAPDIIYHNHKFNTNGTQVCIDVWGADHYSYITRMKAAMQASGIDPNNLIIITLQMVRLVKNGKEFKMSKRTGQSLTTRDLIDAIGKDAARWFLIHQSSNNHIEIDVDVATKKDNNNPLYYVQYAHARANQLLNKLTVEKPKNFNNLNSDLEREIINELSFFKFTIENCAKTYEPYKISVYLYNLAKLFHNYYANTKVLDPNNKFMNEQYYFIKATKQVIANGLSILGISAPDKM